MTKAIKIKCKGAGLVNFHKLVELQGILKDRTNINLGKLKLSIIKKGFRFPFQVWLNDNKFYTVDGHGRLLALRELEKQGYKIAQVPFCIIEAEDKKEAKELILLADSRHGRMTEEGLYELLNEPGYEIDLDTEIFETADLDVDRFVAGYGQEEIKEKEVDENIETDHECPKCGYKF